MHPILALSHYLTLHVAAFSHIGRKSQRKIVLSGREAERRANEGETFKQSRKKVSGGPRSANKSELSSISDTKPPPKKARGEKPQLEGSHKAKKAIEDSARSGASREDATAASNRLGNGSKGLERSISGPMDDSTIAGSSDGDYLPPGLAAIMEPSKSASLLQTASKQCSTSDPLPKRSSSAVKSESENDGGHATAEWRKEVARQLESGSAGAIVSDTKTVVCYNITGVICDELVKLSSAQVMLPSFPDAAFVERVAKRMVLLHLTDPKKKFILSENGPLRASIAKTAIELRNGTLKRIDKTSLATNTNFGGRRKVGITYMIYRYGYPDIKSKHDEYWMEYLGKWAEAEKVWAKKLASWKQGWSESERSDKPKPTVADVDKVFKEEQQASKAKSNELATKMGENVSINTSMQQHKIAFLMAGLDLQAMLMSMWKLQGELKGWDMDKVEKVQKELAGNFLAYAGVKPTKTTRKVKFSQQPSGSVPVSALESNGESEDDDVQVVVPSGPVPRPARKVAELAVRHDWTDEKVISWAKQEHKEALKNKETTQQVSDWIKRCLDAQWSEKLKYDLLNNTARCIAVECGGGGHCGPLSFIAGLQALGRDVSNVSVKSLREEVWDQWKAGSYRWDAPVKGNSEVTVAMIGKRRADYPWATAWWATEDLNIAASLYSVDLSIVVSYPHSYETLATTQFRALRPGNHFAVFGGQEVRLEPSSTADEVKEEEKLMDVSEDEVVERVKAKSKEEAEGGLGEPHWRLLLIKPTPAQEGSFISHKESLVDAWEANGIRDIELQRLRDEEAARVW